MWNRNIMELLILLRNYTNMKVKINTMLLILGITGFYKGFNFNCIKSLPKGIFFLFYELIKT